MSQGISIIICCYNSAWIIERTLAAIKVQVLPLDLDWEVVLVDNNCSDDTIDIARQTMQDSDIDFTVVTEPNPGLANARRKGVDTVKYDIVLYCDDDNILCPDYVYTMYDIMRSDEQIGAAGGKGIAEFMAKPGNEVLKRITGYAIGSQLDGRTDWLFGAGVTLRTELVRDVYYNQHCYLIGRKGDLLLSGDDTELVMSMVNRGYRIYPTDDVYYTHVLKANRLTDEYCIRMHEGFVLPGIAIESMRAAMYETGFRPIAGKYRKLWENYIITFFRWSPNAKIVREANMKTIKNYNFWGIFTLYKIYREWKKIHDENKSKHQCN